MRRDRSEVVGRSDIKISVARRGSKLPEPRDPSEAAQQPVEGREQKENWSTVIPQNKIRASCYTGIMMKVQRLETMVMMMMMRDRSRRRKVTEMVNI